MNDLENQARVDALLAGPKADKSEAKKEVFARGALRSLPRNPWGSTTGRG